MEKVTLAQRMRALAKDRGKTSPTAGQELERMAEEVDALEELAAAVATWVRKEDPREATVAAGMMGAALGRLDHVRGQR